MNGSSGFSMVGRRNAAILAVAVLGAFCDVAAAQTGACCRGDGFCLLTDSDGCLLQKGSEFLGAGTSCAANICLGACCTADKGCLENNRDSCTAAAGSFQGAGTTCDLNCPSHLGTGFTYQGQPKEAGTPVTDAVDLRFFLRTAAEGGNQVGSTQTLSDVDVVNGRFTVVLDFGTQAFTGNSRWLEAAVRRPHDPTNTAPFVPLSPRQEITAAPYATTALSTVGIDGHSLDAADGSPVDALFVDNDGKVGIGTTIPHANFAMQVKGVATTWEGGIAAGGDSAAIVLGELSGVGTLGAHNAALSDWANLSISPGGGNVGIGTTSPSGKLTVQADDPSTAPNQLVIRGATDSNLQLLVGYNTTGDNGSIQAIHQGIGFTNLLLQQNAGNVGIGTTTPASKLSVTGDVDISGARLHVGTDGRVGIGTNAPHANFLLQSVGGAGVWKGGIAAGGSTAVTVLGELSGVATLGAHNTALNQWVNLSLNPGGGRVGVGTTSPANTLSVAGSADFTGNVGIGTTTPVFPLTISTGASYG